MLFRKIPAGADNFGFAIFGEASQHGILGRDPAQSEDAAPKMLAYGGTGRLKRALSGCRRRELQNINLVIPDNRSLAAAGAVVKPSGDDRTGCEINQESLRTGIYYRGNPCVPG